MGNICSTYPSEIVGKIIKEDDSERNSSLNSSKYLQLKHFQYLSTLGEGSFGKVILVRRKSNQVLYAIKLISTDRLSDLRKLEYARFERQVLVEFQNQFIVKLHHIFESSGKICFVLDFMQGGNLGFHLRKLKRFKPELVVFFASEVLIALEILHKREFLYRDLKPENILLDCMGHCKLADFNLSTTVEEMSNSTCGSPEYAAPEVLQGEPQGIEVDFWGFGVLLFHMIKGFTPFDSDDYRKICKNILTCSYSFDEKFSKEAVDLISKLLVLNPRNRLKSHKEIKNHAFFSQINWESVENQSPESPLKLKFANESDLRYFPKKRYPMMVFKGDETDFNESFSNYGDLSYNSEIVN